MQMCGLKKLGQQGLPFLTSYIELELNHLRVVTACTEHTCSMLCLYRAVFAWRSVRF